MNILETKDFFEKCTACGACVKKKKKNAISFVSDAEGFIFPTIDHDNCLNCGACNRVCQLSHNLQPSCVKNTKIGYSKSSIVRESSSSGGLFYELAKYILSQDGVVFGVVFNGEKQCAEYSSTNQTTLDELMKSKYVEAVDEHDVFSEVKEILSSGKLVLFSGTPCKVAGLKLYLKKEYPNLFTVDFKCHGRPSSSFLRDVIKVEESIVGSRCINTTFREKIKGWRTQVIKFYFDDGNSREYLSSHYYYYYFLHNYSIRKSCVNCNLYRLHQSDITLADCWGIDEKYDDDKGMSSIIINTPKGDDLINKISSSISYIDCDYNMPNEKYAHTRKRGYSLRKRDSFYSSLNRYGIDYIRSTRYSKDTRRDKIKGLALKRIAIIKHAIIR